MRKFLLPILLLTYYSCTDDILQDIDTITSENNEQAVADSLLNVTLDSLINLIITQQEYIDSLNNAQHIADSLSNLDIQSYIDSLIASQQISLDSLGEVSQNYLNSLISTIDSLGYVLNGYQNLSVSPSDMATIEYLVQYYNLDSEDVSWKPFVDNGNIIFKVTSLRAYLDTTTAQTFYEPICEMLELRDLVIGYLNETNPQQFTKLSGTIPQCLGNLINLQTLDLRNNILNGDIPIELGNLSKLVSLNLSGNKLTGSIIETITPTKLPLLETLYLYDNQLSGISETNCPYSTVIKLINNKFCDNACADVVGDWNWGYQNVEDCIFETVTDIDGNIYKTVNLGTETWMAENLKVTKYRDGTAIPMVMENASWAGSINSAYSDFNNDPSISATHGRLYNWHVVSDDDNIGLCMDGWHVPTMTEVNDLSSFMQSSPNGSSSYFSHLLKVSDTTYWKENEGTDKLNNNESQFSAMAMGTRNSNGDFIYGISGNNATVAEWWTYNPNNVSQAASFRISNANGYFQIDYPSYRYGFSVRCIKD